MVPLSLDGVSKILCLGAHGDDIEIGCGGAILSLVEKSNALEIYWVVLTSNDNRAKEAERSARAFLKRVPNKTIVVKSFRDGFLPYSGGAVKECFEQLKIEFDPDVIFTHYRNDLHQDHRLVNELTWNTFRRHLILEYEIPKYDADLGTPNFFVPLSESICRRKIQYLNRYFGTQRNKQWFSEDMFRGLLRLRGVESASPTNYAEAFHCRKIIVNNLN